MEIFFPEPNKKDDTWARTGESTYSWLKRSTINRAVLSREFLNRNLYKLPEQGRDRIFSDLRHNWEQAFFELVVGRILQEMGAEIEIDFELNDGHKPDFLTKFSDGTCIVEATTPLTNAEIREEEKRLDFLKKIIEANTPPNWGVLIHDLPDIGYQDPKSEFRRVISDSFSKPSNKDKKEFSLIQEFDKGKLNLTFTQEYGGNPKILFDSSGSAYWDNTRVKIKQSIKSKRSQLRNSELPVILALNAGGYTHSDFEEFDFVLYGHTYARLNWNTKVLNQEFIADGLFCKRKSGEPTFAGVLAFVGVSFGLVGNPILYQHPDFAGSFPQSFQYFENRVFDKAANQIKHLAAKSSSFMDELGFISMQD
ncbi:MAG TPA: hypothetical protein PL141_00455 [Thermoflexales bacterium]|nr:hypothetical protein [Thermoflexales bacterium]HQW34016.1 hypothetical protein [Thermoflexales bacterium]